MASFLAGLAGKPAAAGAGSPPAAPGGVMDVTSLVDKKGAFLLNGAGSATAESMLGREIVHSDAGPQLIIHLPFNETVKLSSVIITAPAGEEPTLVKVFVNRVAFDFADAEEAGDQSFALSPAENGKELRLKPGRYNAVSALTLFLDAPDADRVGVVQLKIMGTSVQRADVSKIQKC